MICEQMLCKVSLGVSVDGSTIRRSGCRRCRSRSRWARGGRIGGWRRSEDLAVHPENGALGHLADGSFGGVVERRLVSETPVELTTVGVRKVLGLDERAEGWAGVPTEDIYLAPSALVEPRLYQFRASVSGGH